MTLGDKALVIRVLAQANGQLTGDPVMLEAGVHEWSPATADAVLIRQAHRLDAQHRDRPLCPGCPTPALCRMTGVARAALAQLEKAARKAGSPGRAAAAQLAREQLEIECP